MIRITAISAGRVRPARTSATSTNTIALARRWTANAIPSIHQPPTAASPEMATTSKAMATVKSTIRTTIRLSFPRAAGAASGTPILRRRCPRGTSTAAARRFDIGPQRGPGLFPLPLDLGADVLHRLDRMHGRDYVEVVRRGRRRHETLERVRLPRVVAGVATVPQADQDVGDRQQHADREDERADRADQVLRAPARGRGIGVDAPRHHRQAERMLDQERRDEADELKPERRLA